MARSRNFFIVPALLTGAIVGLLWGGYSSYVALRNRSPLEVTCAEYVAQRPGATWLRLTACDADLDRLGVAVRDPDRPAYKTVAAAYVGLRPADAPQGSRAAIVLEADDDALHALGNVDPGAADRLAQVLAGPIEGMVEPWELSRQRRDDLAALHMGLANDYVIVQRGARPRPLWFGGGLLAIGGGCAALFGRWRRRWRAGRSAPLPRASVVA